MKPVAAQPTVGSDGSPPAVRISVVVCTRNRAESLPRLFSALLAQTWATRGGWELVVVDNQSTDATAPLIQEFSGTAPFPIVTAVERRRGKAHCLNTGIALARGPIIAFTDDDGIPAPDWLESLARLFDAHSEIVCLGGRVELYDPADAEITVRTSREPAVVDITTYSPLNIPVIGCNVAFRAATLRAIGPFDVALGPGSLVGGYEDVDILYRLVAAGHKINYDPTPFVRHNHGRRTTAQIDRLRTDYATGRGGFYCKYLLKADRTVIRWAYWEVHRVITDFFARAPVTPRVREERRALPLLVVGALRYLRFRAWPGSAD
jgi:glycosyltransferase involved in cell wall biosynthesis